MMMYKPIIKLFLITATLAEYVQCKADSMVKTLIQLNLRAETRNSNNNKCFGLIDSMCNACPFPEQNNCDEVEKMCTQLFCQPLCLDLAWKCSIKATGKFDSINQQKEIERALCSQFLAQGCSSKEMGCCPDDSYLTSYVEDAAYGAQYPSSYLNYDYCQHDFTDASATSRLCSECKANVEVKFDINKEACSSFTTGGNVSEDDEKMFLELSESMKNFREILLSQDAIEELVTDDDDMIIPPIYGTNSMKSIGDRCNALLKKVGGQMGSLVSNVATPQKTCECLGCCAPPKGQDGSCFFPLTLPL